MPSKALHQWQGDQAGELDEIRAAHTAVGGSSRGRRYATQQVNFAYAMLLSSHFQKFCRELHSECVVHVVGAVATRHLQILLSTELTRNRKLEIGNPNPGNIGSDFGRFNLEFWPKVLKDHRHNPRRKRRLEELNLWRNAIAHQDFRDVASGGRAILNLKAINEWRSALNGLCRSFDRTMRSHLQHLTGNEPW